MVGSRDEAERENGKAATGSGGRLGRFCFAAMLAAGLLAGCAAAPETAATDPVPAAATMSGLAGLSAAQLVARLGQPDFRRSDPPAQLWQYRRAGCVLDVFLYRDGKAFRVVHAESHARGLVEVGGTCVDGEGIFAPAATRQSRL